MKTLSRVGWVERVEARTATRARSKSRHSNMVRSILAQARSRGRISQRQEDVLMRAGVSAPKGTFVY